ncbi:hypothetical protein [Vibrio nigripulchritudo]|uniref:VpaChn25_0724 family phage protein n=1 Tax=Vibrio nigripulchritudo TaxID=28173 RepID=UPI0003B1E31B|nr:hypothetical protein [Vibrio nigripulchritudo]CCN69770.1 conserved hypothetical protein [Vibrio nigripulchritudo SFn118]
MMKELLQKDRRLVILRVLYESAGYTANDSVLDCGLDAYGHKVSRDLVKTELTWLQEQGLITNKDLEGTLVSTITQHGIDVATGQAINPGVKRPRPV